MKFFPRKKSVSGRIKVRQSGGGDASNGESLLSSEAAAQLEEMRTSMEMMGKHMNNQNNQMQQILDKLEKSNSSSSEDNKLNEPVDIECGSYQFEWEKNLWTVTGVSSRYPDADHDYFPGLSASNEAATSGKMVSAIIPCYNEEGNDLKRTLRGLSRQRMPPGWKIECVIVMDGLGAISNSMALVLQDMFGVDFSSSDDTLNPFLRMKGTQTVIIHASDEVSADKRRPVVENQKGGFSLVVKQNNHRKANSQQWWLGPHASAVGCKYALATDCGTFFERDTVRKLLERLDDDIATHAVTGTQRTMPADIQGDGNWELCYKPFDFLLRQLQRFEFEVDNVSFMQVFDSLGAMQVIPGPCGLYRYNKLGSLKEGLMHEYFKLFSRSNKGLILGNVELVEDRIPGTLIAFPPKRSSKDESVMPTEGWSKTGLVHDAIFYMEAEKPLSQLVKQRRRWLNGTFATYLWMLSEGIISNSNQDPINKVISWCLVVLAVFQGLTVRLFGPALLIVWIFRFGLFLPDLLSNPAKIFDPTLSLLEVESTPRNLYTGILFGSIYMSLYISFIIGHTPKAKPIQDEVSIVRYTEPTRYENDASSAYRAWLFLPVLWINFIVVVLYIINSFCIVWVLGWDETPLVVKILIIFCFLPFFAGMLDGFVRCCDFTGLWNMIASAPFALPLMVWFTIWLPAYATTRLSDLTWGNRERTSLDESEKALEREENGNKVAKFLICFNVGVAIMVIVLMQFYGNTFQIFVIVYSLILSSSYLVSFIEVFCRAFSCIGSRKSNHNDGYGYQQPTTNGVEDEDNDNTTQPKEYLNMEYISSDYESWCCNIKQSGSNETIGTIEMTRSKSNEKPTTSEDAKDFDMTASLDDKMV